MLKDKMDNTYLLQSRRTEYLKKFQKTTIPLFIEGVYSIYNNVKKNNKSRRLLLKEFQQSMVDVSRWSQDIIKNEHMRFKKTSSVLDKLIKGIFDLDIILKKDLCKNAEDFIPQPWDFVHQCYLNIARALWKQPFLIYDINIDKLTIQQNKLKIEKIVSLCIQDTFTQYLPLDIEHDDVSNIDYAVQKSNQDLLQKVNDDVIETYTEVSDDYGDNNDIITRDNDDLDVIKQYVSDCNDNFKKLNYEINSNLHDNLNVFQKESQDNKYVDDCNTKDNNDENRTYQQLDIQDTNSDILEEYVKVNHDDEVMDSCSDIIDDDCDNDQNEPTNYENNNVQTDSEMTLEEDNDITSENDDMISEEIYETKSFHSEDVSDVDSVDSRELFITHYDSQHKNESHISDQNHDTDIKNIIVGEDLDDYNREENIPNKIDEHQTDIKVINIEDNKSKLSSRREALLNIKKKVKSTMHHSRNKRHEKYGDMIQVERKNMSFF